MIERNKDVVMVLDHVIRHFVTQYEYSEDSVQPLRDGIFDLFTLTLKNNKKVTNLVEKLLSYE